MRSKEKVQKGKGPRNSGERAPYGVEALTHEKECYNGVDGGRVYKYYTRSYSEVTEYAKATAKLQSVRKMLDGRRGSTTRKGAAMFSWHYSFPLLRIIPLTRRPWEL